MNINLLLLREVLGKYYFPQKIDLQVLKPKADKREQKNKQSFY